MNIFKDNASYFISSITYTKPSSFGPRQQRDLQMVYVYEGEIDVEAGDRRYSLKAGEASLLVPGRQERFRFAQEGITRHGWCVLLEPDLSERDLQRLGRMPPSLPFTLEMQALDRLAQAISPSDLARLPYRDKLIQAMILDFLYQAGALKAEPGAPHPVALRALRIMEEELRRPLTIQEIARRAGVSPTHLIRLFKKEGLLSPKQQLWLIRCREAARLLLETGLSASEIAYRTGFANPYHFSRVFKHYEHEPPGRYRRSRWKGP